MTRKELFDGLNEVHETCGKLLEKATEFAKSNDPKLRALAYEISVGVQKITAEQNIILRDMVQLHNDIAGSPCKQTLLDREMDKWDAPQD